MTNLRKQNNSEFYLLFTERVLTPASQRISTPPGKYIEVNKITWLKERHKIEKKKFISSKILSF